jgi:hypothetical protein
MTSVTRHIITARLIHLCMRAQYRVVLVYPFRRRPRPGQVQCEKVFEQQVAQPTLQADHQPESLVQR